MRTKEFVKKWLGKPKTKANKKEMINDLSELKLGVSNFEISDSWKKIIEGGYCAEPKIIELQKDVVYTLSKPINSQYKITEITMNECGQCFDQHGSYIGLGREVENSIEIDFIHPMKRIWKNRVCNTHTKHEIENGENL